MEAIAYNIQQLDSDVLLLTAGGIILYLVKKMVIIDMLLKKPNIFLFSY